MKEFKVKNGPFIKANNSTRKMMYNLIACLVTIMLFSLYKNAILFQKAILNCEEVYIYYIRFRKAV